MMEVLECCCKFVVVSHGVVFSGGQKCRSNVLQITPGVQPGGGSICVHGVLQVCCCEVVVASWLQVCCEPVGASLL